MPHKILQTITAVAVFAALLVAAGFLPGSLTEVRAAGAPVTIQQPQIRVTIPGRPAAGYMTIRNAGDQADAVIAASSPLARKIELHEHSMDGGIMRMREVEKVAIPASGEVAFSSGGYHLMIFGLETGVKPGDVLPVTLTLQSGGKIDVDFPVGKVGDANRPQAGQGGKDDSSHAGHKH